MFGSSVCQDSSKEVTQRLPSTSFLLAERGRCDPGGRPNKLQVEPILYLQVLYQEKHMPWKRKSMRFLSHGLRELLSPFFPPSLFLLQLTCTRVL